MEKHRKKHSGEDEIVFQEIVSKLDGYRSIASNHGVEVDATSAHTTHGILYSTYDFQKIEEHNLNDLLGLESNYKIKSYYDFYELIYDNILNIKEIKQKFKLYTTKFFNHKIDEFRVRNILYKRNNELLYLDISFSSILDNSFVIYVDDVTDYVQDKLLLEEFAVHNNILVKEVHHRVKNNLQILLSLISIQQRFGYNGESITEYMQLSISSMALIHNQLYGDNLNYVSLKRIIEKFGNNIKNFYGNLKVNFTFKTEVDLSLNIDQSTPLFLLLNQLIINSVKHAFDESSETKEIICTFKRVDDILVIKYEDNGRGLPDINEHETGLAHILIDSLIRQIDGEYKIISDKGYYMDIKMPISTK